MSYFVFWCITRDAQVRLQDLLRLWHDATDALEDGVVAALDRSESIGVEEVPLHVNDQ